MAVDAWVYVWLWGMGVCVSVYKCGGCGGVCIGVFECMCGCGRCVGV